MAFLRVEPGAVSRVACGMHRPGDHDPEPDHPEPLPPPGDEVPDQPIDDPPRTPGKPPPPVTARSTAVVYALARARRIGLIH